MAELNYSDDALNVISNFYGARKMLYVEGDDDVVFWESVLSGFAVEGYKIQSVEGKEELKKKIDKITSCEIDSVAAKDLDFSILDENHEGHPSVVTTYAHSIENSIFSKRVICKTIRAYGRLKGSEVDEAACTDWLAMIHESFGKLVVYDTVNELKEQGLNVLGCNCTRFMGSQKSPIPSEKKIENFIIGEELAVKLDEFVADTISLINTAGRKVSDFMRGHFLFSAILKYICTTINSSTTSRDVSYDGLFSSAILAFESVFDATHPHYNHYSSEMDKIRLVA